MKKIVFLIAYALIITLVVGIIVFSYSPAPMQAPTNSTRTNSTQPTTNISTPISVVTVANSTTPQYGASS